MHVVYKMVYAEQHDIGAEASRQESSWECKSWFQCNFY